MIYTKALNTQGTFENCRQLGNIMHWALRKLTTTQQIAFSVCFQRCSYRRRNNIFPALS
jgi:hypothetical protein